MYEQSSQRLIVYLPKELDHHAADRIREEVDKQIIQNGVSAVIFNFQDTTFMDSSGIGLLLGRYKMVNYVGGQVCAVRVNEKLKKLLMLANVHQYVQIE